MDLFAPSPPVASTLTHPSVAHHTIPSTNNATSIDSVSHHQQHSYSSAINWGSYHSNEDIFQFGSHSSSSDYNQLSIQPLQPSSHVVPTRPPGFKRSLSIPIEHLYDNQDACSFDLHDLTGLTDLMGFDTTHRNNSYKNDDVTSHSIIPVEEKPNHLDDLELADLLQGFSESAFHSLGMF